ncbi:hypothetical protein [Oceanobacillus piezotolerans]|uniref:hypothetical protein n=1 Tax=Oceanobacillus piezotolerans TaxID=2448030 RepID=UPI001FE62571|nr:hypothetical protein [Oceanobacillus piezotolerans]
MSKFYEFVPMTYTVEIRVSNNGSAPPNPQAYIEDILLYDKTIISIGINGCFCIHSGSFNRHIFLLDLSDR